MNITSYSLAKKKDMATTWDRGRHWPPLRTLGGFKRQQWSPYNQPTPRSRTRSSRTRPGRERYTAPPIAATVRELLSDSNSSVNGNSPSDDTRRAHEINAAPHGSLEGEQPHDKLPPAAVVGRKLSASHARTVNGDHHQVPQPVKMFSYHETQNAPHRRTMEDAHIFHPSAAPPLGPRTALVAVLDGHGGSRTALDIVLDQLPAIIGDEMRGHPPGVSGSRRKSIKAAMIGAFARMDQELRPCAWQNGLTATVLLIKRQKDKKSNKDCCTVICANVGDSRAILVAPSGRLTRLTQDHRPTSNAAETDRVVNNGGVVLFGRVGGQLAVSRALGDWCLKNDGVISEPSVSVKREVVQGSIVVAASDGVWDVLGDEEVATFVSMHINEEDVAEKLVSEGT